MLLSEPAIRGCTRYRDNPSRVPTVIYTSVFAPLMDVPATSKLCLYLNKGSVFFIDIALVISCGILKHDLFYAGIQELWPVLMPVLTLYSGTDSNFQEENISWSGSGGEFLMVIWYANEGRVSWAGPPVFAVCHAEGMGRAQNMSRYKRFCRYCAMGCTFRSMFDRSAPAWPYHKLGLEKDTNLYWKWHLEIQTEITLAESCECCERWIVVRLHSEDAKRPAGSQNLPMRWVGDGFNSRRLL